MSGKAAFPTGKLGHLYGGLVASSFRGCGFDSSYSSCPKFGQFFSYLAIFNHSLTEEAPRKFIWSIYKDTQKDTQKFYVPHGQYYLEPWRREKYAMSLWLNREQRQECWPCSWHGFQKRFWGCGFNSSWQLSFWWELVAHPKELNREKLVGANLPRSKRLK